MGMGMTQARRIVAGALVALAGTLTLTVAGPARAAPEEIAFASDYPAGAVVIVNKERRLYLVLGEGKALRYPIAIGNEEEEWTGRETVTAKKENPTWYPPVDPGEEPDEPVPGGDPENPLGVRALYLGKTLWRIHGTIAPWSIGKAVSNGCIRMHNVDVVDLYERVGVGTTVYAVKHLAQTPRPEHPGRKVVDEND